MKKNFETFYITWYSRVKRFACSFVMTEEDAEDIVQDVFLQLYLQRDFFDASIPLISYLFISVKNKCLDFLRLRIAAQHAVDKLSNEYEADLRIRYESLEMLLVDFSEEKSLHLRLERALDKLPEQCRKIFMMNKLEGIKQKEIAQVLNLSVNTVETQMGIAYKKLREELKDVVLFLLFLFLL